jgi:predicted AAA+ superfamily ATPase
MLIFVFIYSDDMDKKQVFSTIIADSIAKKYEQSLPRMVSIPLDVPKIISIIGPRRAGKTHLMYYTIQELRKTVPADRLVYINFEDDRLFPLQLEEMENLVQAYYEMYPGNKDQQVWFFFDEIQEVSNWEKFVRRLSDTEQCRIYITGSSSKMLSRELASGLRGRTLTYEVLPLNFAEFLAFNHIEAAVNGSKAQAEMLHWFDRWLKQGGFPELVFLPQDLHRQTISEYLDLMLYRDLTERFDLRNPAMLKYLLKYVLSNLAQSLSTTRIFNDLKSMGYSIGKNTVFDYLSHLEEAFVLFQVPIWHRSVKNQARNPNKFYCIDPAFKYVVHHTNDIGRVFENAIFLHLRQKGLEIHYLLNGQEVDFYWKDGTPINACWEMTQLSTKNREVEGMFSALEKYNLPEGIILTRDHQEEIQHNGRRIQVQPAWRYFLEH